MAKTTLPRRPIARKVRSSRSITRKSSRQAEASQALRKFRNGLVITAEVSGALTFISALLSIVVNEIRFAQWNLSFLAIATPSDLLSSGFLSLAVMVPTVILSGCTMGMYIISLNISSKIHRIIVNIVVAILLSCLIFFYVGNRFFCQCQITWWLIYSPTLAFGSPTKMLTNVMFWHWLVIGLYPAFLIIAVYLFRKKGSILRWLAAAIAMLSFSIASSSALSRSSLPMALYAYRETPTAECPYGGAVEWIGASSLVVTCVYSKQVWNREGATMVDAGQMQAHIIDVNRPLRRAPIDIRATDWQKSEDGPFGTSDYGSIEAIYTKWEKDPSSKSLYRIWILYSIVDQYKTREYYLSDIEMDCSSFSKRMIALWNMSRPNIIGAESSYDPSVSIGTYLYENQFFNSDYNLPPAVCHGNLDGKLVHGKDLPK